MSDARFNASTATSNKSMVETDLLRPRLAAGRHVGLGEIRSGGARQRGFEGIGGGPPDFGRQIVARLAQSASSATGNNSALPTEAIFGLKPFWLAWFQKVVKSGGITTPVTISAWALAEGGDLRGEIVGQILEPAGVCQLVAELVEHGREADVPCRPRRCRRRRSGTGRRPILLVVSWPHMLV